MAEVSAAAAASAVGGEVPRSRRVSTGGMADPDIELMSASREGDLLKVRQAVEVAKANINFRDAMGQTALHISVYNSHPEVVEYLVLRGVDTEARSNDDLTAYQLAVAEGEKECASLIRKRARDLKLIKKRHRRISVDAEIEKIINYVDKRRADEAQKHASARKTAEDSRKAREIARKARQSGANSRADAEKKALEQRGIAAEEWKREKFGEKAAASMATTIVDSDGRRMREARVNRIVRRAVAVFADGIGGLRSLRYNKARRARGDLTAGISPEVAARLVALARMFVQRRHKERLAALPGPDAGGELIGEGQDPAASFHKTIRKVKTAAMLGSALSALRMRKLTEGSTAEEGGVAIREPPPKTLASQSAAPTSSVWSAARPTSPIDAASSSDAVSGAASSAQRAREEAAKLLAELEGEDEDTDDASTATGSASSRKDYPIGTTSPRTELSAGPKHRVLTTSESKVAEHSPRQPSDPNPRQGSLAGRPTLSTAPTGPRLAAGHGPPPDSPTARAAAAASASTDSPLRARRLMQSSDASPVASAAGASAVAVSSPSSASRGEPSPRRGQLAPLRPQQPQPATGSATGSADSVTSPIRAPQPPGSILTEKEFSHADVAKAARDGETLSTGVGSMAREGAIGAAVSAATATEASRIALTTAPRDEASLTPSEAMLLGTPDERRAGFPHDVESLAARRAAAAHRLWVAAHEVANPGIVAAVAAAARGGAEEACRATAETVRYWLRSMLLERYADTLIASGFDTMERLAMMEEEDMAVIFKITPDAALVEEASLASVSIGSGDGISVRSHKKKRRGRQIMAPGHFKQILRAVRRIRKYMDEADVEFMMEGAELMPDSD